MDSSDHFYEGKSTNKCLRIKELSVEIQKKYLILKAKCVCVSSSCLTLSRPPVTSHLTFSERAISVTAPRLWNDLPSDLRTFSLPPPSSLQSIKHHLHHAPLSVTPGLSTRN